MFNNFKIKRFFPRINIGVVGATTLFQALIFASGLIINKLIAIFSGPAGIVIFGVVKNFHIFFSSFLKLGSDNVVLVEAAKAKDNEIEELNLAVSIVRLIFIQSVVLGLSIIFLDNIIYETIFEDILPLRFQPVIKILLFLILLTTISETLINFNNGRQKLKTSISASLIGTLINLSFIVVIKPESLMLVAIFALMSGSISAFILLFIFAKDFFPQIFNHFKANRLSQLPVSSYMMLNPLLVAGTFLVIQKQLSSHYGIEKLSFFILSFTLIATILNLLMSSLRMYFMPQLSSLKNPGDKETLLNEHLLLFLPLCALLSGLIILTSDTIVLLLYSSEFIEASSYLALLALGLLPQTLTWMISTTALAEKKYRLFFAAESLKEFLYLTLVFYLIWVDADFKIIFLGYIATQVIHSLFWVSYKIFFANDFKPKKRIILFYYLVPALLALFLV
ncbi:hypothetical protein N9D54_01615 [Gammaproteobacteria bacterium]|nr:hypothetical protein [Gammaproteobacteria bacterium]